MLNRRRKGGTRVTRYPVRKATLDIPISRLEIEGRGSAYRHILLSKNTLIPPNDIQQVMKVSKTAKLLHIPALHLADETPFLYEDRWVNLRAAPNIEHETFTAINANEWLIEHALFSHGDISFSAANATKDEAKVLKCNLGEALFIINRTTWNKDLSVTSVRLAYAPGFQMSSQI